MEKIEVLAPVGEIKDFYLAIASGANAVFLGLNKFNARMKAENINVNNLHELVLYAHLKNVKVYITLNTLLKQSEFKEVDELVYKCLECQVDAFIVQDLGLIYYLKNKYPQIILHGSTQLGVHNVRGARIAKELGLSRVVLSREVTLSDIKEIKQNVDIELEVFVQGAMCVAFSGNCYMSSLKFNASGNRGECKQLCRLPYILSDGKKSEKGYMISPRDNCMLPYLKSLIDLGVSSLKIEGRLRSNSYITKTTAIYRQAVDEIYENGNISNIKTKTNSLQETFSRGDYTCGYFDGNNIIEKNINNHLGKFIGVVKSCVKFKDIYKISIDTSLTLNKGDGIKFVDGKDIISMGVGNVEETAKYTIVYSKNYIHNDSKVYLSLDSNIAKYNLSYTRKISLTFEGFENKESLLKLNDGENVVIVKGGICKTPINIPLTKEVVVEQLSKVDKNIYEITNIDVKLGNVFLSLSELNELRRRVIDKYVSLFSVKDVKVNDEKIEILEGDVSYSQLAIVNEEHKFDKHFDNLIFSPKDFSISSINKFLLQYKRYYNNKPIVELPTIALSLDLKIIDNIVNVFKNDCIFMINNIYGLSYIQEGAIIFAGIGMNIANDFSLTCLKRLGVKECVSSIEIWCPTISNTYKFTKGKMPLMTFAHCPLKTLYSYGECSKCMFKGDLTLLGNDKFFIARQKIHNCYFTLFDCKDSNLEYKYIIVDTRW